MYELHPDDRYFDPRPPALLRAYQRTSSSSSSKADDTPLLRDQPGAPMNIDKNQDSTESKVKHTPLPPLSEASMSDTTDILESRPPRVRRKLDSSTFLTPSDNYDPGFTPSPSESESGDDGSMDEFEPHTPVDSDDDVVMLGRTPPKGGKRGTGKVSSKPTTPKTPRFAPYTPSPSKTPSGSSAKRSTPKAQSYLSSGSHSLATPTKGNTYSPEEDWLLFQALYPRAKGPDLRGVSQMTGRDLKSLQNRSLQIHKKLEIAIKAMPRK